MSKYVRPFIAFILVGTLAYLFISGQIESKELLPTVGLVIGFYFGERSALKKPE